MQASAAKIQKPMNQPRRPLPPFVAADRAVDRAGDKGAEDRLRHNDTSEEKSAATTEMNEPGEKSAPRTAEAVADEKSEGDRGEGGERDREADRRSR